MTNKQRIAVACARKFTLEAAERLVERCVVRLHCEQAKVGSGYASDVPKAELRLELAKAFYEHFVSEFSKETP